jgi:hypothetical protein
MFDTEDKVHFLNPNGISPYQPEISTLLDNGSEGELFDHYLAHQLKLPIFRLNKIPLPGER